MRTSITSFILAPFARARSAVVALAGGLAVLLSAHQSATAAGVAVGSSTLIGTLQYSDTFTTTGDGGITGRPGAGAFPVNSPGINVENSYGNTARAWTNAKWSICTDGSGILINGAPYVGSGAGTATGMTQTGGPVDYGIEYGLSDQFVVQFDAFQVPDRIDIGARSARDTIGGSGLTVFIRPSTAGTQIGLFNGTSEINSGLTSGIAVNTWHNYAVKFDNVNKTIEVFVDQISRGSVNLATLNGGSHNTISNAAVSVGGTTTFSRLWTDNFQVGLPPATSYAITATAGTGGSIIPSGVVSVALNATPTYTITPDIGYAVADVVLDGTTHLGAVTTYTFASVTASHTLDATFVGVLPAVPTGLTATAGDAKVLLMWTAASGATGYDVKRSETNGGPYTTIASTTATNYFDTLVTNGTPYYYVVSATNATGESADSAQAGATPAAANLPLPAPVSYWSFDESASGTGTAVDMAGGNLGTFNGTVARTSGLLGAGAALFSHNNGINVGSGTGGNFSVTDGITLEMLVKPGTALGGNTFEQLFRKEDGSPRILFSFQNNATILALGLEIGGAYAELDMPLNGSNNGAHGVYLDAPLGGLPAGAVALRDGNTHHIVGLYDKASGLKAIYVDGLVAHSVTYTPGTAIVTGGAAPAYIGSEGVGEPFDGIIDEVAFYNKALSAAQVAQHYDNFQAGTNYFTGVFYNITATAGTGGFINPSGVQSVARNSTPTYTITPDTGYAVADVVLDGTTSLGPVTTYTFAAVTAAHSIDATFVGVLPAPPTGLTATAGTSVLLAWTTASGATGYDVKRSETNGGPYTTIASTTTATNCFDTLVTNGTPYYYVVSATNATGESADSAQAGATPGTPPTAGVIYKDEFNGSASSNLAGQSTTVGGGTWIGSSAWKANGSAGTVVGANGDAVYLPLAVAANATYTLSLTTTMATGDWFALGFANFASPPSGTEVVPWGIPTPDGNTWTAWMLNHPDGSGTMFLHNVAGMETYGVLGHDLKIVLDTAATGWTAEYYVNGASIRGPVALGVSSANYVMFAKNGGTGTVDNFELSVAPTVAPSGYAAWASANGLDPAHPEAVGNDGLANLMVYALDLRTDGTNGSPGALTDGVISFTKRPEAVTNGDVSYAIEVSTDLGVTDAWDVTTTGVTEVAGPPATIAIDLSALGGIRHFARLKVTQIP